MKKYIYIALNLTSCTINNNPTSGPYFYVILAQQLLLKIFQVYNIVRIDDHIYL